MSDFIKDVIAATCVFCLMIIGVIFIGFWALMGCGWVIAGFEYEAWNKLHNTTYTHKQWFAGSDFIKKYHYPNRDETEKKEFNVNVN